VCRELSEAVEGGSVGDDIKQIEIDGRLIGIVGLRAAFEDLSRSEQEDEEELKRALYEHAADKNYVPEGLEDAYAEAIYRAYRRHLEGGEEERKMSAMTWRGIARETIQWYPTVDDGACDGCKRCIEFCSFGVFTYERDSQTVRVESPFACVVGCSLCSSICEPGAIRFPPLSYLDDLIKSRG
jgi:NAD-dependent dihydropyrimidine dehydrogenase PreA subunit